ncbi:esterase/lipase family protein [Alloalcanivorax gelatiniphagus]|uniref:Triacylglycerol lipase n=1 Tax=Alloalcanivorax gelatiniphagus TaxID=1194167 RepID=A0ABY2XIF5_9GAMM|nr:triacylglycerol lipase [Alloalcanivorax gelatiniphagus]TMW10862.1 triacylglycerol lipase [Alloalcanivorax gelatiniphagus]
MIWILSVVLVVVALIPAYVTLAFYLVWFYDRRNFPAPTEDHQPTPLRPGRTLAAMLLEAVSLSFLVASYPLRLIQDASPKRSRAWDRPPVILVHGYGGNSANFLWMQWRLRRWGFRNVYAVSYTPPHINARKLAAQVARHVERVLERTGAEQVDLVCHSMGGPLSRYAIKNLGLAGRVRKVITLGSPHHGTRIAALFPARGAAAQMRYRSPFTKELAEGGECPGGARYHCFYSDMDNFVMPATTARLEQAEDNLHLPYLGHCSLLYSPRVARAVAERLRAD